MVQRFLGVVDCAAVRRNRFSNAVVRSVMRSIRCLLRVVRKVAGRLSAQCDTGSGSGQNVRNLEKIKKAKALWSLKDAKKTKDLIFYLGSAQKLQTRPQVRTDLWAIHLKSPTAALANTETHRAKLWDGIVNSDAFGSFLLFGLRIIRRCTELVGHVVFCG